MRRRAPVSRYFVDARVLSIFEGAEETLALKVVARSLLEDALARRRDEGPRQMSLPAGILAACAWSRASAFIAAPLGGMTLAQFGADVIRIDMLGGGIDYGAGRSTPTAPACTGAGLNKGKRSVALDLRVARGPRARDGADLRAGRRRRHAAHQLPAARLARPRRARASGAPT